jgi:hypothetical protein
MGNRPIRYIYQLIAYSITLIGILSTFTIEFEQIDASDSVGGSDDGSGGGSDDDSEGGSDDGEGGDIADGGDDGRRGFGAGDLRPSPPPGGDLAGRGGGDDSGSDDDESDGGDDSGSDNQDRFRLNTDKIAVELITLSPQELKEYPITDLTARDIELVFDYLTPADLAYVLLNISEDSLVEIRNILTPVTFDGILQRISEPYKSQIENRFPDTPLT